MAFAEDVRRMIRESLAVVKERGVDIYTFSIYHDHESETVSVCVDTAENSTKNVEEMNTYGSKHFRKAIEDGSLKEAALWQANVGRNLSLGNFALVNCAELDLTLSSDVPKDMYVVLVETVMKIESEIWAYAKDVSKLLFTCSTENDEVGLVWCRAAA